MASPIDIKELSGLLKVKVNTLRQWKGDKIITPFIRKGNKHMYNPECSEIRKAVFDEIALDFTNKQVGIIFEEVFGPKDKYLKKMLETSTNKQELIETTAEEIIKDKQEWIEKISNGMKKKNKS